MEAHWEFLIKEEPALRRILSVSCRGRRDLLDDLWCDVCVARIESIMKTYDPYHESQASLRTHVFRNMRMYAMKWMNRLGGKYSARNNAQLDTEIHDVPFHERINTDAVDEVKYLLSLVNAYDERLIRMYYMEDRTYQEIAEVLDVSRCTARNHVIRACDHLMENI